jgi:hypothetical protein
VRSGQPGLVMRGRTAGQKAPGDAQAEMLTS